MRSYHTSRLLLSIFEWVVWIVIFIGLFLAFYLADQVPDVIRGRSTPLSTKMTAATPGLILSLIGLICVLLIHHARSVIDTAELTGQILKTSRDQLEVSRQLVRMARSQAQTYTEQAKPKPDEAPTGYGAAPASTSAPSKAEPRTPTGPSFVSHQGKTIKVEDGKYLYNDIPFDSLEKAQEYIDQFILDAPGKLPGVTRNNTHT
jgi:hypothetical protein